MKKAIACIMIFAFAMMAVPDSQAASQEGRGGVMGFIAGCCFGIRAAGDYNSGKEIGWREWCRLLPYVGLVFAVWDGVEGAQGITRAEYAKKYGATFY